MHYAVSAVCVMHAVAASTNDSVLLSHNLGMCLLVSWMTFFDLQRSEHTGRQASQFPFFELTMVFFGLSKSQLFLLPITLSALEDRDLRLPLRPPLLSLLLVLMEASSVLQGSASASISLAAYPLALTLCTPGLSPCTQPQDVFTQRGSVAGELEFRQRECEFMSFVTPGKGPIYSRG